GGSAGRTKRWVRSGWRNGSRTSSGRTGGSRRRTGPSTRSPRAEKPCESSPERGERHDDQQGATSFRPDPADHPASVSPVRRPLQGVRESGGRSGYLRTQDERSPSEAQSRVLFVPVGIHGGQRRGRSLARLDPLPPNRESSGHLSRCRPRARPRASVPRRQGAVRRWFRVPRSADGNRSLPDVHRRGPPAGDDGPRVVRLFESRMDGRQGSSAARPERWRAAASEATTLRSDTSRSKVRSTLIDFGSGRSSTGSSSNPRAMAQSQMEFLPSIFFSLAPGKRASSPIVRTPERSRSCAVFTPTPLIFVTGSGSRNRVTSSGRTTFKPSGFARSDPILATDLLGPAPIVHAKPSRSSTAAFTRAAYSAAASKSRTLEVTSRNASSMLTCSRMSAYDRKTFMTLSETAP